MQNVLWGALLPFLVWGIWFIVSSPPLWINITAVGLALFLAGYYVWRADHIQLIPGVRIAGTKYKSTPFINARHDRDHRTFSQVVVRCLEKSPVYECVGRLQRVERLRDNEWEEVDIDGGLVLQWSNERQRSIEQHPGAEKALNVFYVEHSSREILPCVNPDADIPEILLHMLFSRIGPIVCFRFYVQITCSARSDGKLTAIAPTTFCLEAQFLNNPFEPELNIL